MKTFYIYDVEAETMIRIQGTSENNAIGKYLKKLNPDIDEKYMSLYIDEFNGYIIAENALVDF